MIQWFQVDREKKIQFHIYDFAVGAIQVQHEIEMLHW